MGKSIQENNELIARFMGWSPDERYDKQDGYNVWTNPNAKNAIIGCYFNYHKDWNMLMPVCHKWDNLHHEKKDYVYGDNWNKYVDLCDDLDDLISNYEIKPVYEHIVNCIEWYNEIV